MVAIWRYIISLKHYFSALRQWLQLDIVSLLSVQFVLIFMFNLLFTCESGTEDIFFDDCVGLGLILTTQICVKIICDALVIGKLCALLSHVIPMVPSCLINTTCSM